MFTLPSFVGRIRGETHGVQGQAAPRLGAGEQLLPVSPALPADGQRFLGARQRGASPERRAPRHSVQDLSSPGFPTLPQVSLAGEAGRRPSNAAYAAHVAPAAQTAQAAAAASATGPPPQSPRRQRPAPAKMLPAPIALPAEPQSPRSPRAAIPPLHVQRGRTSSGPTLHTAAAFPVVPPKSMTPSPKATPHGPPRPFQSPADSKPGAVPVSEGWAPPLVPSGASQQTPAASSYPDFCHTPFDSSLEGFNNTPVITPMDRARSPQRVPAPKAGGFRRRASLHPEQGRGLPRAQPSNLGSLPAAGGSDGSQPGGEVSEVIVSVIPEGRVAAFPSRPRVLRFQELDREESSEVPEGAYEHGGDALFNAASPAMSFSFDAGHPPAPHVEPGANGQSRLHGPAS